MAGGNTRGTCQTKREAGRYQRHHQITRSDSFCDQWLHVHPAQYPIDVLGGAFTHLRITQDERIAQQFIQRNALVG